MLRIVMFVALIGWPLDCGGQQQVAALKAGVANWRSEVAFSGTYDFWQGIVTEFDSSLENLSEMDHATGKIAKCDKGFLYECKISGPTHYDAKTSTSSWSSKTIATFGPILAEYVPRQEISLQNGKPGYLGNRITFMPYDGNDDRFSIGNLSPLYYCGIDSKTFLIPPVIKSAKKVESRTQCTICENGELRVRLTSKGDNGIEIVDTYRFCVAYDLPIVTERRSEAKMDGKTVSLSRVVVVETHDLKNGFVIPKTIESVFGPVANATTGRNDFVARIWTLRDLTDEVSTTDFHLEIPATTKISGVNDRVEFSQMGQDIVVELPKMAIDSLEQNKNIRYSAVGQSQTIQTENGESFFGNWKAISIVASVLVSMSFFALSRLFAAKAN